jgi:acylphosphatase
MVRRRVVVKGDVQGVFFRDTCRREAVETGVAGWVQNRSDGSVEAVFEGDPAAVESMCAWVRKGPRFARVDDITVTEEPAQGETGFQVR